MSEFDEWNKYNLGYTGKQAFEAGQQSRQAEIDKLNSDNQLSESQIGQSCVKWKEISEKRQAEIDELLSRLKTINDYQGLIYDELMKHESNTGFMLNKLEDIDNLSKGNQDEK